MPVTVPAYIYRSTYPSMHACMNGWVDGWMDGWMDALAVRTPRHCESPVAWQPPGGRSKYGFL